MTEVTEESHSQQHETQEGEIDERSDIEQENNNDNNNNENIQPHKHKLNQISS